MNEYFCFETIVSFILEKNLLPMVIDYDNRFELTYIYDNYVM